MSAVLVPAKTEKGWIIDLPDEVAQVVGAAKGSIAVLYAQEGKIEVEVLPPPSAEFLASIQATCEDLKEAFEEMKRLGD